jgi:16S rRNA (cytidine1402-2'-O)-methyltransferase
MLYIIATPIGNLKDITLRALEVLKSVDLIACEDTRRTRILLGHYGIKAPTTSYFQHNRFAKGEQILGLLKQGKNVALVSDAGMPGILDPGHHLIRLALQNSIEITALPGPTAFINALVLSGKPSHKFIFEGFLPNKSGARLNRLKELACSKYTLVFYESPHRILKTLQDFQEVFKDREIVCARELTKKFEDVRRASAKELLAQFRAQKVRGEFVLVV